MKKTPTNPWVYGVSPAPTNWREAADALKSVKEKAKPPNPVIARLDIIEKLVKGKK